MCGLLVSDGTVFINPARYIYIYIYIYIYTVVLSSMTPSFLIGMEALNGTGALINKNTFEGGAYSKGGPQRG